MKGNLILIGQMLKWRKKKKTKRKKEKRKKEKVKNNENSKLEAGLEFTHPERLPV